MPTYDGGHYFLTVLIPVKTSPISDGLAFTSPVHAMRKKLAMLPPAQQTPACCGEQSPFTKNTRNHFARFVIIDTVAYNGRQTENSLRLGLGNLLRKTKINLVVAQPQDQLTCPFLLFSADFDVKPDERSDPDQARNSYLTTLWNTMEAELRGLFTHCERFDSVTDAASFVNYIAGCQIETTMPFNDYYVDVTETAKSLPEWPVDKNLIPAGAGAILFLVGVFIFCFMSGEWGFIVTLLGAAATAAGLWLAYRSLMAAGVKPFPAAPNSNLPAVLKALYLQRVFTRFVIDNQLLAADPNSAQQFHAAFGAFVTAHDPDNFGVRDDQPDPLYSQTQKPGIIGI